MAQEAQSHRLAAVGGAEVRAGEDHAAPGQPGLCSGPPPGPRLQLPALSGLGQALSR